jgi:hypothetical protein
MSKARVRSVNANTASMRRRASDVAMVEAPSMALVPLAPPEQAGPVSLRVNRPDPSFVTHLIAMAEHSPQTRMLRRAATADVQAAYQSARRSLADQNEIAARSAGVRMRLTA